MLDMRYGFRVGCEKRFDNLQAHVRRSRAMTSELLIDAITQACTRFAARGNAAKAMFNQLVACGAWTDAVLLLLQLELPHWKLRQILYEDGEWHCFLSKQPELPLGFDEGVEAAHEVLPLAILLAFIEARSAVTSVTTSVPRISARPNGTVCCENFA
ncbi:MAG TPA: hypothetical protein VKP67_23785 [Xanthobacteraceae bacterium]|nr:hypothetical protein [Xanthobacteraceae bacterium]